MPSLLADFYCFILSRLVIIKRMRIHMQSESKRRERGEKIASNLNVTRSLARSPTMSVNMHSSLLLKFN
jgi:hypothetical protein